MEARQVPNIYDDDSERWEVAAAYRVTLWEQPAWESDIDRPGSGYGVPPGIRRMGWEATEFELVGAQDVREAIQWAEAALAAGEGSASRRGVRIQDREYVIYAKAQSDHRWLHVAGSIPVAPPNVGWNMRRLREHS
jgi:hypothetical protein